MLKEAEIIEQQMMAARARPQSSSGGNQPDYSAQWADYYRSNTFNKNVIPHCYIILTGRWVK